MFRLRCTVQMMNMSGTQKCVRMVEKSLQEGADASEPFEIVDPDASVPGSATPPRTGGFT